MSIPIIRSSTDIRKDYSGIESLAKESGRPIYLTKNGRASLVVIDAASFDHDAYLASELARADEHNSIIDEVYTPDEAKREVRRRVAAKVSADER